MKTLRNILLGISSWVLLTSPVSEQRLQIRKEKLENKLENYMNTINSLSGYANEIVYMSDIETYGKKKSYWQSPKETKERGKGNCSDKAIFLNDTLKKLGLNVSLVYGIRNEKDTYKHVWQEFKIGDENYVIESAIGLTVRDKSKLDKDIYQICSEKDYTDYLKEQIKSYKKRNGVKLKFKNLK